MTEVQKRDLFSLLIFKFGIFIKTVRLKSKLFTNEIQVKLSDITPFGICLNIVLSK